MKKKAYLAALAATCAFAFAAPAFAAPSTEIFADVPAKHWAYEAVYKLAKDGIVSGDAGRFMGDRTITRYEMAVMVANAMTKLEKADASQKAIIDKLGKEFNDDLVKLGARMSAVESRVAKVEQKAKVNFFFDNRIEFTHTSLGATDGGSLPSTIVTGSRGNYNQQNQWMERLRVYMNASVGDEWQWDARLVQAKWNLNNTDTGFAADRFWLTNKNLLGGTVEMGKMMLYPGKGAFYGNTGNTEGLFYTKKLDKATVRVGNARNLSRDVSFAEVTYRPTNKSDFGMWALKHDNAYLTAGSQKDYDVRAINGAFEIPGTGGLALSFEYAKNHAETAAYNGKSGYFVALQSKYGATNYMPALYTSMVNPFKKGDHGWGLSYRHMPTGVAGNLNRGAFSWVPLTNDTLGAWQNTYDDVNAWRFDYVYVPWKNVQWTFTYDHVKPINGTWTNNSLQSTFNFFF